MCATDRVAPLGVVPGGRSNVLFLVNRQWCCHGESAWNPPTVCEAEAHLKSLGRTPGRAAWRCAGCLPTRPSRRDLFLPRWSAADVGGVVGPVAAGSGSPPGQSQTRAAGILLRHNNRLEDLQQTLDLHSGRLDRIEDNQRRMADSQGRQFEHLSAQMAEILGTLRGPVTADPAPESEQ